MIQVLFTICFWLLSLQKGSFGYVDRSVSLRWETKDNQLIFICKVSKLFLPVVISRESLEKARCVPNPEPVCHVINPKEGSILLRKSTNETIYTITNYKLETVNGEWSCSHGSSGKNPKDSVVVNIYHSVSLRWKTKDNQLIFICKVSKLFLPVVIYREGLEKAQCDPNPEPVCHVINPKEGSILFRKSTNETIFTITNYKLETVNGDWSCSHGSSRKNSKDSVVVNIHDTCPYVYVGVPTSLLVTLVLVSVIGKCKNAYIAAKGAIGGDQINGYRIPQTTRSGEGHSKMVNIEMKTFQTDMSKKRVRKDQEITNKIQQNNCGETIDEASHLLQIDRSKKGKYTKKGAIKGDKEGKDEIQQNTIIETSGINSQSLNIDQAKKRKKVACLIICLPCLLLMVGYIVCLIVYVQKYCYCTEYLTIISAAWIAAGLIVGILNCVVWSKVLKEAISHTCNDDNDNSQCERREQAIIKLETTNDLQTSSVI